MVGGAIQQMAWGGKSNIELDLPLLIDACFAAGAAMISFGAVLGRMTPSQITFLLVLQVPLASFDSDIKEVPWRPEHCCWCACWCAHSGVS